MTYSGDKRPSFDEAHESLVKLRDRLPKLIAELNLDDQVDLSGWTSALDRKLLPRFSPDFPLIVAIAGGGSAGKSTLFNALVGAPLSLVKSQAGASRRVLIGAHPEMLARGEFVNELFQPFRCVPEPLESVDQLGTPGDPVYVASEQLPPGLILLDTPDFDVGGNEEYVNREAARPALEACDVLIYLFTGATYRNLSNANFVREIASSVGRRKCVLVYRTYESYTAEEVAEHSQDVAQSLYGGDHADYVLAIYRAADTNEVAAGKTPMAPRPIAGEQSLIELLGRLDPREVRREHVRTLLTDIRQQATGAAEQAELSRQELELYVDALKVAQSHAVKNALSSLPLEEVALRVRRIWEETSPPAVRGLRSVSKALGLPFTGAVKAARWVSQRIEEGPGPRRREDEDTMQPRINDLEDAANELYRTALVEEIDTATTRRDPDGQRILQRIETIRSRRNLSPAELPRSAAGDRGAYNVFVPAHPMTRPQRDQLAAAEWKPKLANILHEAGQILKVPEKSSLAHDRDFDAGLREVVEDFRQEMPLWRKLRETVFASLHILPPVAAISWVLLTGDAATAGGVAGAQTGVGAALAAKVTGLFGLNDLWALVALPAGAGLSKADQEQLSQLLQPVIQQWFQSRSQSVQNVLQQHITAPLIDAAEARLATSGALQREIDDLLQSIQHAERAYADG